MVESTVRTFHLPSIGIRACLHVLFASYKNSYAPRVVSQELTGSTFCTHYSCFSNIRSHLKQDVDEPTVSTYYSYAFVRTQNGVTRVAWIYRPHVLLVFYTHSCAHREAYARTYNSYCTGIRAHPEWCNRRWLDLPSARIPRILKAFVRT